MFRNQYIRALAQKELLAEEEEEEKEEELGQWKRAQDLLDLRKKKNEEQQEEKTKKKTSSGSSAEKGRHIRPGWQSKEKRNWFKAGISSGLHSSIFLFKAHLLDSVST